MSTAPPGESPRAHGGAATRPRVQKPVLASEALKDELAPLEPGRGAARIVAACAAVVLLAVAGLGHLSLTPASLPFVPAAALGGLGLLIAVAPLSYATRAAAMVAIGAAATIASLGGLGVVPIGWRLVRFVAGVALPAALLFRARYRAYPRARWILGVALTAAVPAIVASALVLVGEAPLTAKVGAGLTLVATLGSLAGFMGAETTGAATFVGLALLGALSLDLGLSVFGTLGDATFAAGVAAAAATLSFGAEATLAAVGAFGLLASRYAADARRIDLHQSSKEPPPPPPSSPDWTLRG